MRHWIERHAALLVIGALAVAVLSCSLGVHELWRDECQAALIADRPSELLGNLRYEGHPPLVYVLLAVVSLVIPRPYAPGVVGALGFATLLAGTYHWLRAFSPASRRVAVICTAMLASTYTYSYELGIVSRGYGLGIGLALLGAAIANRRAPDDPARRLLPVVLCLAGAILASLHTACLALCIALAFAVHAMRAPGDRIARVRRLALVGSGLVPALLLLLYVAIAPDDRVFTWIPTGFHVPPDPHEALWKLAVFAFAPTGWWTVHAPGASALALLIVAGFASLALVRSQLQLGWFLAATIASTLALTCLFVFRYFGEYRHHTVLAVPVILCLAGAVIARPRSWRVRVVAIPLALWLAHEAWLLVHSVRLDVLQPFSQAREVAARLPDRAMVVAGHDLAATCVAYYRPDAELRAPQAHGRPFTFVVWDQARTERAPLKDVIAAACAGRSSVFVIGDGVDGPSLVSRVDPEDGISQAGEYFALHEVACPQ